jgi:sec-independent protein translocase protein TatA|tara:strand:+ start:1241 stop:1609 length:369 start_codon:yes stop_codon:yes gene_type:complete
MVKIMDYFLNIMGSEWMIIIFVALILLFGTNKLPEAGKKIGKMVGEYNKAKTEMQNQINEATKTEPDNPIIDGPVQTERQKLEKMAQTLRINIENKSDSELKNAIDAKFGPQESNSENKFKN